MIIINTYGKNFRLSLFGESHGKFIGITIEGIPAGCELDLELINKELKRRRPAMDGETARREVDDFSIISGYFNNKATGAPITFIIPNKDIDSTGYEHRKDTPRPGHADYTAHVKYFGNNDYRGGGMFSGRLTVAIVIAGAIAKQQLHKYGVAIGGQVQKVYRVQSPSFIETQLTPNLLQELNSMEFPTLDEQAKELMQREIATAGFLSDSVGGVIEVAAINMPAGWGEPWFSSVESEIAKLMFSIPSVKAVEFGLGFGFSATYGSEANDPMFHDGEKVGFYSNNAGGIVGGITNGMPIIVRLGIKPTPSIGKGLPTVNLATNETVSVKSTGRHDSCLVNRAIIVAESMLSIALLDFAFEREFQLV